MLIRDRSPSKAQLVDDKNVLCVHCLSSLRTRMHSSQYHPLEQSTSRTASSDPCPSGVRAVQHFSYKLSSVLK